MLNNIGISGVLMLGDPNSLMVGPVAAMAALIPMPSLFLSAVAGLVN